MSSEWEGFGFFGHDRACQREMVQHVVARLRLIDHVLIVIARCLLLGAVVLNALETNLDRVESAFRRVPGVTTGERVARTHRLFSISSEVTTDGDAAEVVCCACTIATSSSLEAIISPRSLCSTAFFFRLLSFGFLFDF